MTRVTYQLAVYFYCIIFTNKIIYIHRIDNIVLLLQKLTAEESYFPKDFVLKWAKKGVWLRESSYLTQFKNKMSAYQYGVVLVPVLVHVPQFGKPCFRGLLDC